MAASEYGIKDLEYLKFYEDDDGFIRIRTSSKGTFSPTGLSSALKITTMDISDSITAIPVSALSERNAISIYNKSDTVTVFIGPSNVTADSVNGTTSGWELDPGSYINFDVTDNVIIYGVCPTGETAKVKIMEIA